MVTRLLMAFSILFLTGFSSAQVETGTIGIVSLSSGESAIVKPDGRRDVAQVESRVSEGDTLETSSNAMMHVRFASSALVSVRCDSKFEVRQFKFDSGTNDVVELYLIEGEVRMLSGNTVPANFQFHTSLATVSINEPGTDFSVSIDALGTINFDVFQGSIAVASGTDTLVLGIGRESAYATVGNDTPLSATSSPSAGIRRGSLCPDA